MANVSNKHSTKSTKSKTALIQNPDKELAQQIRASLKANDGYCPCKIDKTEDTKCICKEFREQIEQGIIGECHCGLYQIIADDT